MNGVRRELLAMRGIVKRFAGVPACDAVDLTLYEGDVLGLLGENGAGKTTLMNVLFGGAYPPFGRRAQARHRHGASAFSPGAAP